MTKKPEKPKNHSQSYMVNHCVGVSENFQNDKKKSEICIDKVVDHIALLTFFQVDPIQNDPLGVKMTLRGQI